MQFHPLSAENYTYQREILSRSLSANAIAILHSNDKMPLSADQFFSFRQNKDLLRLTGIYQEDTALVLFPDHPVKANQEIIFIKKPDDHYKTWDGDLLTKEQVQNISGVSTVHWIDEFESIVYNLIPRAEIIYLNSNELRKFPSEIASRNERLGKKLIAQFPFHTIKRLQTLLRTQTLIKTKEEIEKIRKAIQLTGDTWNHLKKIIKPGISEYEIAAEISYRFEKKGAIHAFQPIIAGGKSACILHYTANKNSIVKDDLILIDFGAEVDGYAADMTRCIAADGSMTKRQFEIYDQVLTLYTEARKIIKPGITLHELQDKMQDFIWQSILELQLTSNSSDKKNIKKYLPHGISHFLGMEVHDYGDKHIPLAPNMIITCEPGLYVESEGIGIRLENDLLITKDGNEDLGAAYEL